MAIGLREDGAETGQQESSATTTVGLLASPLTASRHGYAHLTQRGFDLIGIIEALVGLMVESDNNKRPVEFKDGCRYGKFGRTKAYD